MGAGLTCFGIVAEPGGKILFESVVGEGTRFDILLHISESTIGMKRHAFSPKEELTGDETILLVDDEPALRDAAKRALESHGYRVIVAANGVDALAKFNEHEETIIDLLATDVVMPIMGGMALANVVLELDPGVKVGFTSGYVNVDVLSHSLPTKSVVFLSKPYLPVCFLTRVRQVADFR